MNNDYDLDYLNQLLDGSSKTKELPKIEKDHLHWSVRKFIRKMNISIGQNKIPSYLIYIEYRRCKLCSDAEYLTPRAFFKCFKKEFELRRTGKQRYYLLNSDSFNSDSEYLNTAKNTYDRMHGKKEKQ